MMSDSTIKKAEEVRDLVARFREKALLLEAQLKDQRLTEEEQSLIRRELERLRGRMETRIETSTRHRLGGEGAA